MQLAYITINQTKVCHGNPTKARKVNKVQNSLFFLPPLLKTTTKTSVKTAATQRFRAPLSLLLRSRPSRCGGGDPTTSSLETRHQRGHQRTAEGPACSLDPLDPLGRLQTRLVLGLESPGPQAEERSPA